MKSTVGIVVMAALSVGAPIGAQWLTYPSSDAPRTKDGKVDMSARAPKLRDGKADLSGLWRAAPDPQGKPEGVENEIFPRYFVNVAKDLKPEEMVLRPAAATLFKERLQDHGKNAPEAHCVPVGVPGISTFPSAFKIVQMPRLMIMLYEKTRRTGRSSWTDDRFHAIRTLRSWGIRLGDGRPIRLWLRASDSGRPAGWIGWGTRTANSCT